MNKEEKAAIEEFEEEWKAIALSKIATEPDEPVYMAKMTKGPEIQLSNRDVNLVKRKAKTGFKDPIYRVYGMKSTSKHPDQLINFNKLIYVRKVGDYEEIIKQYKKRLTRCSAVVETGANVLLSDDDFILFNKRVARMDLTPIVLLSGEIDGTILLNLNHVVHAYRRTYESRMSKEKYAARR